MAREDIPVLDREMFRKRDMSSRGIEDLPEEVSAALRARREQAMAMMEASKEKFDPKNFQTLTEQDRPGVFRPVAVNMPAQQQTATTAQRMQQMADMGMRPIGMAEGGYFRSSGEEGWNPYERSYAIGIHGLGDKPGYKQGENLPSSGPFDVEEIKPTVSPDDVEYTVSPDDVEYFKRLAKIRRRLREIKDMPVEASVKPEIKSSNIKNLSLFPDSTERTTYEGGPMANDYGNESVAKTRAGRAIQDLLGKNKPLSENKYAGLNLDDPTLWTDEQIDTVSKRFPGNEEGTASALRAERQMARDTKGGPRAESIRENFLKQQEELGNIEKRAPIPGLFEEASPLQVQKAEEARAAEVQRRRAEAESEGIVQIPKQESPLGVTEEPSTAPTVSDASGDGGLSSLIRSGRGAVEKPGERLKYLTSRAEGNLPSGPPSLPTKKQDRLGVDTDTEHPTSLYDIKRDREDAFNTALMMAGLGMMAGKSSNALANIGEGGIMGLKAYTDQLAQSRARALEKEKLGLTREHYKLMGSLASQRASTADARIKQAQSAAIQKGEISAQAAYDKWLTSMEGQGADDTKKAAKLQQLRKTFTQIHFAEMTSGSSSNPDSLDLSGE